MLDWEFVLVAGRLLLAAVFGVAGLAKLVESGSSRQQSVAAFGIPERLAGPAGRLLPLVELAVAAALVVPATARLAAAGAFVLLAIFSLGIAINLARGQRPACRCFGSLVPEAPIGWRTLVRNGVLGALAAVVAFNEPRTPSAWSGDHVTLPVAVVVVAGVLVAGALSALSWFMLQLLGQHGRILQRLEVLEVQLAGTGGQPTTQPRGLPVGTLAPEFSLLRLDGEATESLGSLLARGKPALLAFVDPHCSSCMALLPQLAVWQRDVAERLTVVPISLGDPAANRAAMSSLGLEGVLLQRDQEVADLYHVTGTPSGVVVQPNGTIGSALAEGVDAIRRLVATQLVGDVSASGGGRSVRAERQVLDHAPSY